MQRCKVVLSIPCKIEFLVRDGEEETAEELIERLQEGDLPIWMEELILRSLKLDELEVIDTKILGQAPGPEEELNFDY